MPKHHSARRRRFFWTILLIALLLSVGWASYTPAIGESSGDLIINEFVAANETDLIDEDGDYSDANAQARWLSLNNEIEQAIIGESARWRETHFEQPLTQEHWFKARDDVLAQLEGNATQLIALAREAGY